MSASAVHPLARHHSERQGCPPGIASFRVACTAGASMFSPAWRACGLSVVAMHPLARQHGDHVHRFLVCALIAAIVREICGDAVFQSKQPGLELALPGAANRIYNDMSVVPGIMQRQQAGKVGHVSCKCTFPCNGPTLPMLQQTEHDKPADSGTRGFPWDTTLKHVWPFRSNCSFVMHRFEQQHIAMASLRLSTRKQVQATTPMACSVCGCGGGGQHCVEVSP